MYIVLGYILFNVYLILYGFVVFLGEKMNLNILVWFIWSVWLVVYDDVIIVFKWKEENMIWLIYLRLYCDFCVRRKDIIWSLWFNVMLIEEGFFILS